MNNADVSGVLPNLVMDAYAINYQWHAMPRMLMDYAKNLCEKACQDEREALDLSLKMQPTASDDFGYRVAHYEKIAASVYGVLFMAAAGVESKINQKLASITDDLDERWEGLSEGVDLFKRLGGKLDERMGVGQQIKSLAKVRNALMHFKSDKMVDSKGLVWQSGQLNDAYIKEMEKRIVAQKEKVGLKNVLIAMGQLKLATSPFSSGLGDIYPFGWAGAESAKQIVSVMEGAYAAIDSGWVNRGAPVPHLSEKKRKGFLERLKAVGRAVKNLV